MSRAPGHNLHDLQNDNAKFHTRLTRSTFGCTMSKRKFSCINTFQSIKSSTKFPLRRTFVNNNNMSNNVTYYTKCCAKHGIECTNNWGIVIYMDPFGTYISNKMGVVINTSQEWITHVIRGVIQACVRVYQGEWWAVCGDPVCLGVDRPQRLEPFGYFCPCLGKPWLFFQVSIGNEGDLGHPSAQYPLPWDRVWGCIISGEFAVAASTLSSIWSRRGWPNTGLCATSYDSRHQQLETLQVEGP